LWTSDRYRLYAGWECPYRTSASHRYARTPRRHRGGYARAIRRHHTDTSVPPVGNTPVGAALRRPRGAHQTIHTSIARAARSIPRIPSRRINPSAPYRSVRGISSVCVAPIPAYRPVRPAPIPVRTRWRAPGGRHKAALTGELRGRVRTYPAPVIASGLSTWSSCSRVMRPAPRTRS
jgi:hypothetical protein